MPTEIAKQIQGIKREVKEFHPLLHEVFDNHPQIVRVEYTHGSSEKGADFVLVRRHDVLDREEYVGVIAKVGKIHQDIHRIKQQVDECLTLQRPLEEGKKQIQLNEVWIVTTSTITPGAKENIYATHKASKVHFVSGHDLAKLVKDCVPHYWSRIPVETSTYLDGVRTQAREQDERLDLIQVAGDPIYIEQEIERVIIDPYTPGKNRSARHIRVRPLPEIESKRFLLIEASMGGGKSKFIRHLVQRVSQDALAANRSWLPVNSTYKSLMDDHGGSLTELLNSKVPRVVRDQLADDGLIVFFIDAVDEKEQSQSEMFASMEALSAETRSDSRYRLILTSRVIGNLDFDKQFLNTINRYRIRRLTIGKMVKYLKEVCRRLNLTNRMVDDIRRSPLFAKLPQNPLAAVLLAQIVREDRQDLPATLPELYSKYIELALGRWDISKGLQSQREYEVLEVVLMDVAGYFLDNDLDAIGATEFRQRIAAYLDDRNLGVDSETIFTKAVERSDLIVASRDQQVLRFKHRSFAEFLEAKRRVRDGTMRPALGAFEMYWANVYYFACGEMKDAPAFISALASLEPQQEQHRWLKPMNMANYVMAAYSTPYGAIERAVYHSIVEAARLFYDIVTGKQESYFGRLSRMDLLCLMQVVISRSLWF